MQHFGEVIKISDFKPTETCPTSQHQSPCTANTLGGLLDEPKVGPDSIPEHKVVEKGTTEQPNMSGSSNIQPEVMKKFRGGTTQHDIQEHFNVKLKQLATCIMGCKYLGGSDHKASRKCKALGEEASSSQQIEVTSP